MIKVSEALANIISNIRPLGVEEVETVASLGRTLAEDVTASRPNPPWDNSAMDGYALRAVDAGGATRETPARLKVIYDLPAGSAPKGRVGVGEAVRIMTGAPVPEGADAVVMVEETEKEGESTVLIRRAPKTGENIRRSGEDFKSGELVVKKGAAIRPAEISMLATVGAARVKVYRRPTVAVVSTGDELVEIGEKPEPGRITNCNGYLLSALVSEAGGVAVNLGIARDTREDLSSKLRAALSYDCIISSGGVSVGDYDFVKDVLKELGSEMIFWKVAIKPGKPLAFGMIGGRPAFGLPGNPISSYVSFEQFVRPSLLKMAGRSDIFRSVFKATITEDLKIKPGRTNFIRAVLSMGPDGAFTAAPREGQGSGIISTLVKTNAFIIVPAESGGFSRGAVVDAVPFDLSLLSSERAAY